MDELKKRDDELFAALNKSKKQKRRKRILTALLIAAVIIIALLITFASLRRRVQANIASTADEVLRYEANYGSISTRVTGTGTIVDMDTEKITVPEGVEIDEVIAEANTRIKQGDAIATVDMASVLNVMADVQDAIADLDSQLREAGNDTVSSYMTAGAAGRVKKVYAEVGTDVASCMYENGALVLLSLDGYMAADITTDQVTAGQAVTVVRTDGTELPGTVETVLDGVATILLTDNGPELDENVTVQSEEGESLGGGTLYIHNPLRITGFAGTVSYVLVRENQYVYAGSSVINLKDTSYSARYETILKQRREQEETLQELLKLRQSGALRAPFDGTVLTVDYGSDTASQTTTSTQAANTYGLNMFGSTASAALTTTSPASDTPVDGTVIVTMSRDESMSVTISVDESDILSLQIGQAAEVTIDSIGEDVYRGTVTEIDKTANSSSGVTSYAAEVSFDKAENMLSGMSADVVIRIQGTENVLIVPADAIHRTSALSFVYTSYDAESGMYGGMKPVETGISNDDFVEIKSGLEAGEAVYYTEKEEAFFFGFGGGFPNGNRRGNSGFGGRMG